jgi:histone deacetylase 1/2
MGSTDISSLPTTYRGAFSDPNWKHAMEEEYGALLANQTRDLVQPPPHANIVSGKCSIATSSMLMDL